MKSFCCKGAVFCCWGVLLLEFVSLMACANGNEGNAVGPDVQNGKSSSSFSSSSRNGSSRIIHGFAQKTPFVDSSVVQLTALDESTLELVGVSFSGMVDGGFSRYSVKVDSLESRFVQISVTGDVLGYNSLPSEKVCTLYAIADLDSRDSVNVNLLTHLEFERVRKLVRDDKLPFAEAKKQAEKELFEIFHVPMKDGEYIGAAEDWSLFGDSLGDQVLMGLTVVFDRYKDSTVSAFIDDFAKNGKSVDDSTIYRIAKIAFNSGVVTVSGDVYLPTELNRFRNSFDRWKSVYGTGFDMTSIAYHGMIPEFEKTVEDFWRGEFGLEECDEGNLGVVGKTRYEEYYTCAYDVLVGSLSRSGYYWRVANALEANSYGIKCDSTDYFMTPGGVNSSLIVCDFGKWRYALDVEKQTGLCTSEKEGSLEDTDKYGYVCKSNKWEVFTDTLEDERDGKRYAYRKAVGLYWMIDDLGDTTFVWADVQCPEGWRLPTYEESLDLREKLGGWRIPSKDGYQMNFIDGSHSFNMWWTSKESEESDSLAIAFVAEYRPMNYQESQYFSMSSRSENKSRECRVRCVKVP
ncbi:hypothetical protein [uncultured Fibrobacter sp.]|uniref:hypothetical protein n=1 Tax=uncultured Fibrobacter sp. TaxID=261512 RepID=UPI0025CF3036|nr:hypothetical protein [uncultured Fibrobacter sp.]